MAKIRLNSDKDVVATVREGLRRKGGYCPCRMEKKEEYKCMCEEFKAQIADPDFEGYCHCMLYYKEKDPLRNGFSETKKEDLPEISAVLHEMKHARTGLRLYYLERPDDNKTFGIAFRTIPENDTGVFHILEHSVLCGSDRYPVKEPFVELMKSSMNTFLNAMTYPDKTFYPVSSKNDKDFFNLMRVYLDAVFHPLIYKKPETLMQEGWHLEADENGTLTYSGVVYSEMKGAFADADTRLNNEIMRALYPDSAYRFVSGGDPKSIPELTEEEFLNTHRRFYAPANACIFLDGTMDIDAVLKVIDEEYLSVLEIGAPAELPAIQAPVNAGTRVLPFEIAPEEDPSHRASLAFGRVTGTIHDTERNIALQILCDVLTGGLFAPLTGSLVADGLAEDVSMYLDSGMLQPLLVIKAQNLALENTKEAEARIMETLTAMAEEGIDPMMLESSITNMEFRQKELDFGGMPHGIVFGMSLVEKAVLNGDVRAALSFEGMYDDLRKKAAEGYFEQLIREAILENPHAVKVIMEPSVTCGEEERADEAERLSKLRESMTEEELSSTIEKSMRLLENQGMPDSPEALATIPTLELSDIPAEPEDFITEERTVSGIRTVCHPESTGDIAYVNLYFNANALNADELPMLSLASALITEIGTSELDAGSLMVEKRMLFGTLDASVVTYENEKTHNCDVYFRVSFSTLSKKLEEACGLVCSLLTETDLSRTEDVMSLLGQKRMEMFQILMMDGVGIGLTRAMASVNAASAAAEHVSGYSFYEWLKNTEETGDAEGLAAALAELLKRVIGKANLTLTVTGNEPEFAERIATVFSALPEGESAPDNTVVPVGSREFTGIAIPADTAYSVAVWDLGGSFNGQMTTAAKLASLNYLWMTVRMQNGAYGTGMNVTTNGCALAYSYRDPDPAVSVEAFNCIGDWLQTAADEADDLTGFIIGTIADQSQVMSARMRGESGDRLYFSGRTYEDRRTTRKEILGTTAADLKEAGRLMASVSKQTSVCVVGSEESLKKCGVQKILRV